MSVLIVTSLGDIVVDLFVDRCPLTCKNFLKLCKIKYYNGCLFHTIQKDFTAQTGDPTGTGAGGDSVYKFLYGDQARFFGDEIRLDLKHTKMGTVAMASGGKDLNASQFYLTLRDDLDYLDGKHTVFGEIAEGLETLQRINEAYCDEKGRPYKNIRIKHTYILDDPFDDPQQITELIPDASPEGKPKVEVEDDVRLEDDWVPMDEQLGEQLEEVLREKAAHSRAVVLESIGDIPDAEMKPPDNVLFVCKLNPVTEDDDLNTIFSRFGTVTSAEIIRDFKTGDSLCYAFIEFESEEACAEAYFKMNNALIDDRRIHVDFSQSVAKLWSQYRRKDSKMAKGKGCFKCGAPDHIAKDCQGESTAIQQPSSYILKDDNNQHGGGSNSRYEMVFDEDAAKSPQREKRSRDRDREDHPRNYEENREREKRDRHRQNDRNREYKEYDRNRDRKSSQPSRSHRDVEYHEEPRNRDKSTEKNGHGYESRRERDDQAYRKRRVDSEASSKERNGEGNRRENGDNGKRDSRDESRHKRTSGHADDYKGKREERDYGKRSRENDESRDRERDTRKHRSDGRR